MKKSFILKILISIITALFTYTALAFPVYAQTKGVKTSYKRYSIFKYKDEDVLCEPYTVTKNDWLYKIFRKKGEISEQDFPKFIVIFKEINPTINNVDAIEPGINILIPLKKVNKAEYDQGASGEVDIPVVEFSAMVDNIDLKPFFKKHTIEKGETISNLIDKDFLEKSGSISKEGIKAFQLANPDIKNINIIYERADIYLPDPSIKSQSWFQSLLAEKILISTDEIKKQKFKTIQSKIHEHELVQLKKYAALIGGTLLNQGEMYFPRKNGTSQVLDLSSSPVIETEDGSKILVISGNNVNAELLAYVQTYWKGVKTQLLSEISDKIKDSIRERVKSRQVTKYSVTREYKKIVETLLSQTDYDYIPDTKIAFAINNINLEAKFGRVIINSEIDLLINFGEVYGSALDVLKRKFKIFSLKSKMSMQELTKQLFLHLGYTTWQDPSFSTKEFVQTIHGLYAVKNQEKIFVFFKPLSQSALNYLQQENIKIVSAINKEK